MKTIRVYYRYDPEGWWAESDDLPAWTAVGDSFSAVREQARAGIIEFAGEDVAIEEEGVPTLSADASTEAGTPIHSTDAVIWRPLSGATQSSLTGGDLVIVIASTMIPSMPHPHPSVADAAVILDERLRDPLANTE